VVESFTVQSGGARLHCEKAGEGACVILLHAGVADARMWRSTLAYLARTHMAVAYDRRGYGGTTTPDEAFSHVDDLERIREVIGVERVSLVGCSQGGRVAVDYALAHPERLTSLVLVASAVSAPPRLTNTRRRSKPYLPILRPPKTPAMLRKSMRSRRICGWTDL
jgi:pimeloyl-ACP methyl ester carboxylesterase